MNDAGFWTFTIIEVKAGIPNGFRDVEADSIAVQIQAEPSFPSCAIKSSMSKAFNRKGRKDKLENLLAGFTIRSDISPGMETKLRAVLKYPL